MSDVFSTHGAFSWTELMTNDVAAATDFYSELFGWQIKDTDMGNMTYSVVSIGDQQIGGIMTIPEEAGAPPHWGGYVTVDDVDSVAARAVELGGKLLVPATDIPGVGRFCVVQDPQGATISAITYNFEKS